MNKQDLLQFYTNKVKLYAKIKNELQQKSKHISILRLSCAAVFACALYLFFKDYNTLYIIVAAMSIGVFLFLIKKHDLIRRKRAVNENLLKINQNEINVLKYKPSSFDSGTSYITDEGYCNDLDVFGDGSLFHLLNRTSGSIGSKTLAEMLANPIYIKEQILNRQATLQELAERTDFRQLTLATAQTNAEKEDTKIQNLLEWAKNENAGVPSLWRVLCLLSVVVTIASISCSVLFNNYYFLTIALAFNFGVTGLYAKKVGAIHSQISGANSTLQKYSTVSNLIDYEKFNSAELNEIQVIAGNAKKELKRLGKLIQAFDQRLNLAVAICFNGFFVYDLFCTIRIKKWNATNSQNIPIWFKEVGRLEMLNSFATYCFNNNDYAYPTISDVPVNLTAKNLSHPLIPDNKRVSNDFISGEQAKVVLITGSNMSGKSTFLRSIGVNQLLACCGTKVCASEMNTYPARLYTSLRQSDSLQENTSFFYAELKKLQYIVNQIKEGNFSIVLLDEILKGTNSDDKSFGSQELIKKLVTYNSFTILATHDIKLSELENDYQNKIRNYCFESIIENNQLHFDYKLQTGVAHNKNATFLMKKMDII